MPTNRQLNVTELDFDQIKKNLVDHFKSESSPYRDWDFEGSGLNLLVELLAYNTHYNAILAHSAMNESFLDTAQVRNNVVARAKALGYIPRSTKSARARIRITFNRAPNSTVTEFSLPVGSIFRTRIDDDTYTFVTREVYTATVDENNRYVITAFDNIGNEIGIDLYEGTIRSSQYIVNGRELQQKFIIDDSNVDIETLRVRVFENGSSNDSQEYMLFNQFGGIDETSPIYFIYENTDGLYEVNFGDGLFGKRPSNLNIVELEYISANGSAPNKASIFEFASPINVREVRGIVAVDTLSVAEGGGSRESIESIRQNAPLTYISQNRAVTEDDYRALLRSQFSFADVAVWGGQNNVPPEYGKVFVSIFKGDEDLNSTERQRVLDFINKKSLVTVIPEIRDPEFTFLYFRITASYDPERVRGGAGEVTSNIISYLPQFSADQLAGFDRKFRYSLFLNGIDRIGPWITNSFADVYIMKRGKIYNSLTSQFGFSFGRGIKFDNRRRSYIWSDNFIDRNTGQRVSIATKPSDEDTDNPTSTTRERDIWLIRPNPAASSEVLFSDAPVGKINLDSGAVTFDSLTAETGPLNNFIEMRFYAAPEISNVVATKNEILQIDAGLTRVIPRVDSTLLA